MAIITNLARWARDLTFEKLPASVAVRARLQHLSTAGAVRAVRGRSVATTLAKSSRGGGKTPRVAGGNGSVREAIRLHAGLASWLSYDDTLFLGQPASGPVVAAWAASEGRPLSDLICATVVGNEIAARVAASMTLGPCAGPACAPAQAAGVAATLGWLQGLDADELAHALAIALASAGLGPLSTLLSGGTPRALAASGPAVAAYDAVIQAQAGVQGSLDLLDARDGLLGTLSWAPLRNAFTGLGSAWFTETLSFSLSPSSVWHQTAVQGVQEILRRHVKAADKRLRLDQLERIEIRAGALPCGLEQLAAEHGGLDAAAVPTSMRRAIGALVVAYEYGPSQLEQSWLDANHDDISEAARRVEVSHDWRYTVRLVDHLVDVLSPLFAGVTLPELVGAGQQARRAFGTTFAAPGAAELLALVQARPDRVLERLRHTSGDMATARLREWQMTMPVDIKLFTTRGGSWPEERSIPVGSPGWPWDKTISGVLAKLDATFAEERASGLYATSESAPASEWLQSLLG